MFTNKFLERKHNDDTNDFLKSISPSCAYGIQMGEIGVTNAKNDKYIIGSHAAAYCVIVIVYNRIMKIACASHIHIGIKSINTALDLLEKLIPNSNNETLEVYLSTSYLKNNKLLDEILKIMKEKKNMKLFDVFQSSSLLIDTKTGNVYSKISDEICEECLDFGKNPYSRHRKKFIDNPNGAPTNLDLIFDFATCSNTLDNNYYK